MVDKKLIQLSFRLNYMQFDLNEFKLIEYFKSSTAEIQFVIVSFEVWIKHLLEHKKIQQLCRSML